MTTRSTTLTSCAFYFMLISTCKITLVRHSRWRSVASGSTPLHSLPCMLGVRIPPLPVPSSHARHTPRTGAHKADNAWTLCILLSWYPMDQPILLHLHRPRLLHRLHPRRCHLLHLHLPRHCLRHLLSRLNRMSDRKFLLPESPRTLRAELVIEVMNLVG